MSSLFPPAFGPGRVAVLLLPLEEPVQGNALSAAVELEEEEVRRWLRWCLHVEAAARAESAVRSIVFATGALRVFDDAGFSLYHSARPRENGISSHEPAIFVTPLSDLDDAPSIPVYEAAIEISDYALQWSFEPSGAVYRCTTSSLSRAALLRFVCRVTSVAEVPGVFAELLQYDATVALDVLEHGLCLPGEQTCGGRDVASTLSRVDLLPALEAADPVVRERAIGLIGKLT